MKVARSAIGTALLVALCGGCPYVAEGEIRVATGSTTIGPGAQVALLLYCDRLFAGWEIAAGGSRCAGAWQVEGGGTITACGVYTAPDLRPASPPVVSAIECSTFDCADACGASITLDLAGYDR